MSKKEKEAILQLRKILGVPDCQRIGQSIWNKLSAHDFMQAPEANFLFYLPDEVFYKVMTDKSKFCVSFKKGR
jgi:hypothetical protein